MDKMEKAPWHVKLRRWWSLKLWVWKFLSQKYWDKTHPNYIFKKFW
jgi:hypothetical protein